MCTYVLTSAVRLRAHNKWRSAGKTRARGGKQYCRRSARGGGWSALPGAAGAENRGKTVPGSRRGGVRPIPLNRLLSSLNLLRHTSSNIYIHVHAVALYTTVSLLYLSSSPSSISDRTLRKGCHPLYAYIHIITLLRVYTHSLTAA